MKKNKSIRSSLFITYSLIIIVVSVILVSFFCIWESNLLKKQFLETIYNLSDLFQEKLDNEIKNIDMVSVSVLYADLIKESFSKYLNDYNANNGGKNPINNINEMDTASEIINVLSAINGPFLPAKQIYLYNLKGRVFCSGFDNVQHSAEVGKKDWYAEVMAKNGSKVITLPYKDAEFSRNVHRDPNTYYISLCRAYFVKYGTIQGIVEVMQYYDTIFNSIDDYFKKSKNKEKVYVYNDSGALIYPISNNTDKKVLFYYNNYRKKPVNAQYLNDTNPETRKRGNGGIQAFRFNWLANSCRNI